MNRANIHVTKTGVQIGGHYLSPPMPLGKDALTIQMLLIDKPASRFERFLDFIDRYWLVWFAVAAAIGIGTAQRWLW